MAQQIEGAAPTRLARMATWGMSKFKVGTPLYSLGFGAVAGIGVSALVYGYRTLSVVCFDHEYYKMQSRKRYLEKQLIFQREQEEKASAHYLASLSSEYDPVATRMPFKPLDPKYRF
mmetsp:Transcript_124927/g.216580  ORF Transcript_124927/g.216580 Transcript_124927/m.216580 type:complete len:117 (+) Transcript_124927:92-442(+)